MFIKILFGGRNCQIQIDFFFQASTNTNKLKYTDGFDIFGRNKGRACLCVV